MAEEAVDLLVVADTHIRRGSSRTLPTMVHELAATADVILHAGDIVVGEVLDDLRTSAPVHAVLGNNDHELIGVLPETVELTLGGVRVAMLHDSGQARGRGPRLRRRFPDADLVVFGHSHIPWDVEHDGQVHFNPGSPTERRRQPHRTAGTVRVAAGRIVERRIVIVDDG